MVDVISAPHEEGVSELLRFRVLVFALVFVALRPGSANASETACVAEPDVDARYTRILEVFDRGQGASRLWWYGWMSTYAAATVSQGILAVATSDRGTRIDSVVGGAEAAIGVVGLLVATPRTPMWAAGELRAMRARTACDRLRRLRRAESLLEKSAEEQAASRSWYTQLLGGVINLAAPVVLWFGYRRYASGWYTLGPGLAVQEAQILTQPTSALGAWNAYSREHPKIRQSKWTLSPLPGGAAVTCVF